MDTEINKLLFYIYKKNDLVKKEIILKDFPDLPTVEINKILYKLCRMGFVLEASEKIKDRVRYYYKITEDGKLYVEYLEKNNKQDKK